MTASGELPHSSRAFRALGLTFRFETDDDELVEHVERVFSALPETTDPALVVRWQTHDHDRDRARVTVGEAVAVRAGKRDSAMTAALWNLNRAVVAASTSRWLLLHAAAAVHRDVLVVLAAPSESGKSTTVAGLVRDGWSYITDEAVAVDVATLDVEPYPRPICLDPGSWSLLQTLHPEPSDFEAAQWHVPPPRIATGGTPSVLVFPRYQMGATTRCEPVQRAEAVQLLAQSTFEFLEHPHRNLPALARLARSSRCVRLTIGDLDEAVRALRSVVDEEFDGDGRTESVTEASAGSYPEGLVVEEVDGQAIVLDPTDGSLHVLDAPATALWQLARSGSTPEELAQDVAAVFGIPHERADGDVRATLSRLDQLHLLTARRPG